jgi:DNA polymerase (family 10)
MENPEVAQLFDEVADLLELQSANPFRIRAYRNAARTIRDLPRSLAELVRDNGKKLAELPGIGDDLAGKIQTIVATGDLPLRIELCQQVPAGLRDLLRLPGCGPKRVQLLHQALHINTLADLGRAARRHAIRELKGFGPKSEENLLKALEDIQAAGRRVYLAEAQVYAEAILKHLRAAACIEKAEVAGSYRRRKETVGDLDVLVCGRQHGAIMDCMAQFEGVTEVLARGPTKMTARLKCGLQVDVRVVASASYGAALVYFTGSKQHNIELRKRGQERGLKINEYGVFRGNRRVAGRAEEEVYRAVNLPWIPPELREARGEIELAREGRLPKLVELGDIRGDLHMHTTATDGRATIEEMIAAAKDRGYSYIAITDHSKRVTMAKGLGGPQLRAHWKAIERAAAKVQGIRVLKGVEVDILEDGRLDLPDSVLKDADWVVASIHYGQNQPRRQITQRLLGAIHHPWVHVIGHPTGRLIGVRKPQEVDLDEVLKAAAEHGCMLELNCQPSRLDLDEIAVSAAVRQGATIVLGSDAHATEELRFMQFGVYQARRGGLEPGNIANTRPLAALLRLRKRN